MTRQSSRDLASSPGNEGLEQERLSAAESDGETVLLRVENLRKEYRSGTQPLVLFDGLNLTVRQGEMIAIVGESGAGKSTLLHLLAALDRPSAGDVYFASTWLGKLTAGEAATFRNREIGYVWQLHYLLPEFTALENVAMPLLAREEAEIVRLCQSAGTVARSRTGSQNRTTLPGSFPVGNNSAFRWHGRWSHNPGYCWRTSQRATSITVRPKLCLACWNGCTPRIG